MKLVPALKYLCIPLFLTLRDIEMNDIHHNPAKNNLDLLFHPLIRTSRI